VLPALTMLKAKAAAASVVDSAARADLATKADLADLKSELIEWVVGTLIAMTGLFAAIVKLL
jgi:hypothetical protein